jgi:hypothetical protein
VAEVLTFTVALLRVRQVWRAQVSPSTTVSQLGAGLARVGPRTEARMMLEMALPMPPQAALGDAGLQAGDRIALVEMAAGEGALYDLSGVRPLRAAWQADGTALAIDSAGRTRLTVGASQPDSAYKPDIDLRSALPASGLPAQCALLSYDAVRGGWSALRIGGARVQLDELELPTDLPVTINAQAVLRVYPPDGGPPLALHLTQGQAPSAAGLLPAGDLQVTVWGGDETVPLTLRASLNLPVARLVGALAGHLPYPSGGGGVQPYVLRLAVPQARLTPDATFYRR